MPTYQYRCTECGTDLEAVQKFTDPTLTECPTCHGSLRKVFNAVGVVFKGSGFYRTDSRPKEGASSGSSGSGSESKGSESKGSESKGKDGASTGTEKKSSDAGSTSSSTSGSGSGDTKAPAKASSSSSTGSGSSS